MGGGRGSVERREEDREGSPLGLLGVREGAHCWSPKGPSGPKEVRAETFSHHIIEIEP